MFFKYYKQKVRREKVKRLVVLLSSFLFLCTFASASPLLNFTSPTPADNATVNTSITINVSSDETLDSCILVWDFPQWCYEETANESTACGGLDSGLYKCEGIWDPVKGCSETYDGVWGDGGSANKSCTATLYVNYTIPNYNYNSIWKLKYSNLTSNNTLPSGCLNDNVLQFKVHSSVQDTYSNSRSTWLCWNYDLRAWWPIIGWTGWEDGKGIIFEEAVWWDYGTAYDIDYSCSTTGGTSQVCTIYDDMKLIYGLQSIEASCSDGITSDTTGAMAINMTAGTQYSLDPCLEVLGVGCSATYTDGCYEIST